MRYNYGREKTEKELVFTESVIFSDSMDTDENNSPLYKEYSTYFCAAATQISKWKRYEWIEDTDEFEPAIWLKQ